LTIIIINNKASGQAALAANYRTTHHKVSKIPRLGGDKTEYAELSNYSTAGDDVTSSLSAVPVIIV
jgi:hypothetical protein